MFTKLPTLLSPDRLANLIKYSHYASRLSGAVIELGVYKGGSLELLANENPGTDIFGVDSFQGLSAPTQYDFHNEGEFADVDAIGIIGYFKMMHPSVRIIKSFIPDAFKFFDENARFRFAHIDLDLYQPITDSLNFLLPRMTVGGVIVLDDFGFTSTPGCPKAIEDFFSNKQNAVTHRQELKYFSTDSSDSCKQYLIIK